VADPVDPSRVVELRRRALERVGYDDESARELAGRIDIPLQEALALRRTGLPPDVALELLTSGDRPVF
jgi:hypothetical protein